MTDKTIAVIGLGYVGLPLAIALAQRHDVVGYDIDGSRVADLLAFRDFTQEVERGELETTTIKFTASIRDVDDCDVIIVCLPTPIDSNCRPSFDCILSFLESFCDQCRVNKKIFVFESTVYPGATRTIFASTIEELSGCTLNQEFFVGYSPERINPGDRSMHISQIVKLVSGSNPSTTKILESIYASVIDHVVVSESIEAVEAAKVIENTQRDVNIALMNEFSEIFNALGLDTFEILKLASTKWNFLSFLPGLVGGHCIGVDPYYLIHRANEVGAKSDLIFTARKINAGVPGRLKKKVLESLTGLHGVKRILILGATFKENCPDFRNSPSLQLAKLLKQDGCKVVVIDPYVYNNPEVSIDGIKTSSDLRLIEEAFDAVLITVKHSVFKSLNIRNIQGHLADKPVIFDLHNTFPEIQSDFSF